MNESANEHGDGVVNAPVVESVSDEQAYYDWRAAHVGEQLSLKDAFLAGRGL